MAIKTRAVLLLASVAVGAAIGAFGTYLTKSEVWYLAVPVVVALGWLFVADPTRCHPGVRHASTDAPKDSAA